MKHARTVLTLVLLGLLPAAAATADDAESSLSGSFRVGYRSIDVDGSMDKYREDVNLGEGPRVMGFRLDYRPPEAERRYADRIDVEFSGLGGDAFETFRFEVQKYGRYDLELKRAKSNYFYHDVILPIALAEPSLSNAGDFHTFDFDRVHDTATFDLRLSPRAELRVGFDRFTRRGESTTTLDIQRDEFEFDRPIDEIYEDFRVGFQYAWPKATLIVEERRREYRNPVELFLPGASVGEDPDDLTFLNFFFLDQPYEYEAFMHTVRINARPTPRLLIRAAALVQDLDLTVSAAERSQGVDFAGRPFGTDRTGGGDVQRDSELFDVDFSCRLTDRIALVGGVRQHELDQEGRFDFAGDRNRGVWDIETTAFELGFEASPSPPLTFSAGVRVESRDVESGHVTDGAPIDRELVSTDHDGFFAGVAYRPSKRLRLELELEDSAYDNPFTLSSPTDRQRYRLRLRLDREDGIYAMGTFLAHRYENDLSGWQADRDQLTLRAGCRRGDLDLSAGYSMIEADREIQQSVTTNPGFGGGVTFLFPILYRSDADFFDLALRYRASDRLRLGAELRFYDATGSFAVEREDLRGFVEIGFGEGYLVYLSYRTVDYDETRVDFDDYAADIAELAIGYRF